MKPGSVYKVSSILQKLQRLEEFIPFNTDGNLTIPAAATDDMQSLTPGLKATSFSSCGYRCILYNY